MKMEVVLSSPGHGHYDDDDTPYKNEEIHEWSGVDKITGMLETARIETGRWRAFDDNSAKSYGKVTDLRERNSADGSIVQKARRQVEIYQSKEPGRSVQVVRASHWSSSRMTDTKEFIFSKKLTPWNNPKLGEYSKTTIKSPSNTRKNILSQKRCNSNEDLSVLTDSSTSKNDFIRNLQTRRSLQIPTTSKNSTDTAKRITRNDKIDENKINDETMENKNESDDNDDKIYTKISSAITGNKSSSIIINTPTVKTIKKPQITVINLIDSSSNYSDNNNKKKSSIVTLKSDDKNQNFDKLITTKIYNTDDDNDKSIIDNKKSKIIKKVDFCKTEIHFAADSGKVNIVETIKKPPPTNKYRRKRKSNNNNNTNNNNNNNNNIDINKVKNSNNVINNDQDEKKYNNDNDKIITDDDKSGAYAVVDLESKKYWNNTVEDDTDNHKIYKTKIKFCDNNYDDSNLHKNNIDIFNKIDELTSPKAVSEINSRVKNIDKQCNIVTKDNDNNQVYSTIIKTHETIIARVDDNLLMKKNKIKSDEKKYKKDDKKLPIYANVFNKSDDKCPIYENYRLDNDKKINDNELDLKINDKKKINSYEKKNTVGLEKKKIKKISGKFESKKSPSPSSSSSTGIKVNNHNKDYLKIKEIKKTHDDKGAISKNIDNKKKFTGTVKKPVEVVYKTAVYNIKNEKLVNNNKKLAREKNIKTGQRILDDLICGSKSKNSKMINNKKKAINSQGSKSTTQPPRHWK